MPVHFLFSMTTAHFRVTYNSIHMHRKLFLITARQRGKRPLT